MSIVLNEHYYAEQAIQTRSLGKKPSETLSRVARYYIDNCDSANKKTIRSKLDLFLLQCDSTASIPKWSKMLDFATDWAFKHKAIQIDSINITKPEMDKIDSLDGKQIRRLAFVLLCLSKYWNIVNSQNDNWVNSKDNEIMAFANINTSIRRQCAMYATLRDTGLIQFSKKVDNTNVRVCFAEDGEVAMTITDLRNLGYQYLKYHGEPYFECTNCGITVKIDEPTKGRKQKYCKECAVEVGTKQRVNYVMRQRETKYLTRPSESVYTVYMHKSPNNKKYIGITSTTLHQRWQGGTGYRCNQAFYSDIQRYGWDNIKHYKVFVTSDESLARDVESYLIQQYKTYKKSKGYNRVTGAVVHGYKPSACGELTLTEVDGTGAP